LVLFGIVSVIAYFASTTFDKWNAQKHEESVKLKKAADEKLAASLSAA